MHAVSLTIQTTEIKSYKLPLLLSANELYYPFILKTMKGYKFTYFLIK